MASPGRAWTQPGLSSGYPNDEDLSSGTPAFGKRTRKPNSVLCGHSSRRRVAANAHQRPTRRFRRLLEPPCRIGPMRNRRLALGPGFPPYLVLLRVGFTLPPPLLTERCALTAPFHPYPDWPSRPKPFRPIVRVEARTTGRYVFCGTSRPRTLKPASRTLSGTLPSGVRTFLSRKPLLAQRLTAATARSSCQWIVYRENGLNRCGTHFVMESLLYSFSGHLRLV